MLSGVLLDMDGLLFDTERLAYSTWIEAERIFGFERNEELIQRLTGASHKDILNIYAEYFTDFENGQLVRDYRKNRLMQLIRETKVPMKKGALELLQFLKSSNLPVALATSSNAARVMWVFEKQPLYRYFDAIISGDMVNQSKPHPEIFLRAAAAISKDPSQCVVLEDSFNGIRAGYAAGAYTIMVPDRYKPDAEIAKMSAFIADSLLEAMDHIRAIVA